MVTLDLKIPEIFLTYLVPIRYPHPFFWLIYFLRQIFFRL